MNGVSGLVPRDPGRRLPCRGKEVLPPELVPATIPLSSQPFCIFSIFHKHNPRRCCPGTLPTLPLPGTATAHHNTIYRWRRTLREVTSISPWSIKMLFHLEPWRRFAHVHTLSCSIFDYLSRPKNNKWRNKRFKRHGTFERIYQVR